MLESIGQLRHHGGKAFLQPDRDCRTHDEIRALEEAAAREAEEPMLLVDGLAPQPYLRLKAGRKVQPDTLHLCVPL